MFDVGSPFHLYMMEESNHKSKVDKLCGLFRDAYDRGYDINRADVQDAIFMEAGITFNDLTSDEIELIKSAIY